MDMERSGFQSDLSGRGWDAESVRPPSQCRFSWIAVVLCLSHSPASANLTENECSDKWGSPLSCRTNESGHRILSYSLGEVTITATYSSGKSRQVVFLKPGLARWDIPNLLEAVSEGQHWSAWTPPGRIVESASARWLRSDKLAVASREDDQLAVNFAQVNDDNGKLSSDVDSAMSNSVHQVPLVSSSTPVVVNDEKSVAAPASLPPLQLPSIRDTREKAVRILGVPAGMLKMGDREIWTYAWGQVYLDHGKVLHIEKSGL